MKNFLSILVGLLVVIGCTDPNKQITKQITKQYELDSTSQYFDKQYRTYTLEGCEYIVVGVGNDKWGSHKGNCKNSIHKQIVSY